MMLAGDPRKYIATNPNEPKFLGWINSPPNVESVLKSLPIPLAKDSLPEDQSVTELLTYQIFKNIVGKVEYPGPQLIGDCVGHGWKRGVDYTAVIQIHLQLKTEFGPTLSYASPDVKHRSAQLLEEFQEASCEAIYALSRVEVGTMDGSYSDGSIGAWAGKAVVEYGTISWKSMNALGMNGYYDSKRAKEWGAKGLPDNLEPLARQHTVKNISLVTSWDEAKKLLKSGYVIPVCSNRGFTVERDKMGFCSPSGTWNHCMMISSYRSDREGALIHQNWGLDNPTGPKYKEQPSNTFWSDANVIDYMLSQRDSFCPSAFTGYPVQNLLTWAH